MVKAETSIHVGHDRGMLARWPRVRYHLLSRA